MLLSSSMVEHPAVNRRVCRFESYLRSHSSERKPRRLARRRVATEGGLTGVASHPDGFHGVGRYRIRRSATVVRLFATALDRGSIAVGIPSLGGPSN